MYSSGLFCVCSLREMKSCGGEGVTCVTCVSVLVCQQDQTETAEQISIKLGWRTGLSSE